MHATSPPLRLATTLSGRIRPRALRAGDRVAIVAPAGPVDRLELARGQAWLHSLGLRVTLGKHVFDQRGYLAGDDRSRAADLEEAFADPGVAGIICARGGYGAMRLLPHINWAKIRENPKVFCGFSDITALHLALAREANMVTFHGPMVGVTPPEGMPRYNGALMQRALCSTSALGRIPWPGEYETEWSAHDDAAPLVRVIAPGEAVGPLVGGNLTLLCAMLGTPWELDTDNRIVLIEDINEQPRRMDRMLMQLLLAGKVQRAAGIVIGHSPTCEAAESTPSLTLAQVLTDLLGPLGIPVVYGFPFGHGYYRATLPLGVHVRLRTEPPELEVLEPATTA